MKNLNAVKRGFRRIGRRGRPRDERALQMPRVGLAALALCLAWALLAGCEGGAAYSSEASADSADSVVVHENPNGEAINLDSSQNEALYTAQPLDLVKWTKLPAIEDGGLTAAGEVLDGARLFNPEDGEGFAFEVRYKTHEEPMVVLLPDLGPAKVWESFLTIAPTDFEISGAAFSFRAYSPLLMDVGSGDLELRVYGYDKDGNPALLAVLTMGEE